MDISDTFTTDFEPFDGDTRASKLRGVFVDESIRAVVIVDDGEYLGVVTRRQLASSHQKPNAKARNLVWAVPKVAPDEDVREVARLMVGSNAKVLPVLEDGQVRGVVTADGLLEAVTPYLHVLTVDDVRTRDLVSVAPDTTVGEAVHLFREHRVTHLPVVEDDEPVGVISLFDVLDVSVRKTDRSQGGSPRGFDGHGGEGSAAGFRTHGGFGAREGDVDRLLDLPVENLLSAPVATVAPDERLDRAVDRMFEAGTSSLLVVENGDVAGIVTKTDVLRSLTWADEPGSNVQITGVDLMDDISREEVTEMIERSARKYGDMTVLETNVYLHEHDEKLRGTPLILARIRLFTDKGHFVGTGEGYGARHALHLARNVLEREILEGKEYGRTKKLAPPEEVSKLLGWWLSAPPRRR